MTTEIFERGTRVKTKFRHGTVLSSAQKLIRDTLETIPVIPDDGTPENTLYREIQRQHLDTMITVYTIQFDGEPEPSEVNDYGQITLE
jgi:hypothetical protein